MQNSYGCEVMVGDNPLLAVSYVNGRMRGTAIEKKVDGTIGEVLTASKTSQMWFERIRDLHIPVVGVTLPYEYSVRSVGSSGRVEFSFKAGKLERKLTYDQKTRVVTTDPAPAFDDVCVTCWLDMHRGYDHLARLIGEIRW